VIFVVESGIAIEAFRFGVALATISMIVGAAVIGALLIFRAILDV